MTDEELIILCRQGDKTAWERLYGIYKSHVLSIARRFFLFGGETDDLAQEGMFGLISAVNDYKAGSTPFSTYSSVCIRNRILDAVKRNANDKNSALNNFCPIDVAEELLFAPDNPEDEIINRENGKEFLQKIGKILSPLEYKAILSYVDGMTVAEISSKLSKSVKSIDNALTRAKRKLSNYFSAEN